MLSSDQVSAETTTKVLCTVGVQAVVEELAPHLECALGRTLNIRFGVANAFKRDIDAGETFDVGIFTGPVIDELIGTGRMAAGSRKSVARSGLGLAVAAGAPRPDIRTVDAFERTLLEAKSIVTTRDGISGIFFVEMLRNNGLYEKIRPKLTLDTTRGLVAELVAEGAAQYAVQLVSELMPVPGSEVVGPVPEPVQRYVTLVGGVSVNSKDPGAAAQFLQILTGEQAVSLIRSKGLEPA